MRSDVANLITYSYTKNDYGVLEKQADKRKVYVDVASVSSSEFFEGGRNGLRPVYRFTIFRYDYENEDVIEYNGTFYSIYRTYVKEYDQIELYVEFRKGNEE